MADNFPTVRALKPIVRQLLVDYGFSVTVLDEYVDDVADLVLLLGQVKVTEVGYLELQPYRKEAFDEEGYNDAVVNIFTRLNNAGRTLSEQAISYAWIKSYWDTAKTGGRQADECFAALREGLTEHGLKLDDESVVRVVSTIWSAVQNKGALLSSRDLLNPGRVKPLAIGANVRWDRLQGAALWTAERVEVAGLKYRTHYESLNAVIVLMAWRAVGSEWLAGRGLSVTGRDEFEKRIAEAFDRICVRWFAVTQWARVWAVASGKSFATMAADLAQTCIALEPVSDPEAAVSLLQQRIEGWLAPLLSQADEAIDAMAVAKREQVSQYYLPLWVWHRLDESRSEHSKLVFRDGKKEPSLDVDHLVAAKAWERLIGPLGAEERAEIGPTVNDLGNCWLMEKNFNISKSDGTLVAFLNKVKEFKTGEVTLDDFGRFLGVTNPLFNPTASGVKAVREAIETRTQEIKQELKAFVRGKVVPVS